MDTKVKYYLNLTREELTERQRRSLLNQLAFEYGIRLHAREYAYACARPAERDSYDEEDDDYNTSALSQTKPNSTTYLPSQQQLRERERPAKMKIVQNIINRLSSKEVAAIDLCQYTPTVNFLMDILSTKEFSQLTFEGIHKMYSLFRSIQDESINNKTSYMLKCFSNMINNVDYHARWVLDYKYDHGEINEEEYRARLKNLSKTLIQKGEEIR